VNVPCQSLATVSVRVPNSTPKSGKRKPARKQFVPPRPSPPISFLTNYITDSLYCGHVFMALRQEARRSPKFAFGKCTGLFTSGTYWDDCTSCNFLNPWLCRRLMRRSLRYLRIAFSATCVTACVLLIALWVRSYWRFDQILYRASATEYVAISTHLGQLALGGSDDPSLSTVFKRDWTHFGFSLKGWDINRGSPFAVFPASTPRAVLPWPRYYSPFVIGTPGSTSFELSIPYWLLVLTLAAFGTTPWLRWRFGLRTLLIATTLIALVLGAIVWMSGTG
jgi:hypothetical protein